MTKHYFSVEIRNKNKTIRIYSCFLFCKYFWSNFFCCHSHFKINIANYYYSYPIAPLARIWVWRSNVSWIDCGEYNFIGELNWLFTNLGPGPDIVLDSIFFSFSFLKLKNPNKVFFLLPSILFFKIIYK